MDETREKLVKELTNNNCRHIFHRDGEYGCPSCRLIADFIIADRARIVEPLVKCVQHLKDNQESIDIPMFAYHYAEAIGKTIRLSNGLPQD
jgi:hypothetical protein